MAVDISDTKHYKKGDKLPDGTIAKRGVVWNTKTGKRVTGTVMMSAVGQGGMGATKSYKAGRAVVAAKKSPTKKSSVSSTKSGGSRPSGPKAGDDKSVTPPAKKVDKINTRRARDRAMAGRPRGSATTSPRSLSNKTPSHYTGMSVNRPGSTYKEQRGIADDIRRMLTGQGRASSSNTRRDKRGGKGGAGGR